MPNRDRGSDGDRWREVGTRRAAKGGDPATVTASDGSKKSREARERETPTAARKLGESDNMLSFGRPVEAGSLAEVDKVGTSTGAGKVGKGGKPVKTAKAGTRSRAGKSRKVAETGRAAAVAKPAKVVKIGKHASRRKQTRKGRRVKPKWGLPFFILGNREVFWRFLLLFTIPAVINGAVAVIYACLDVPLTSTNVVLVAAPTTSGIVVATAVAMFRAAGSNRQRQTRDLPSS